MRGQTAQKKITERKITDLCRDNNNTVLLHLLHVYTFPQIDYDLIFYNLSISITNKNMNINKLMQLFSSTKSNLISEKVLIVSGFKHCLLSNIQCRHTMSCIPHVLQLHQPIIISSLTPNDT